MAVAIELRDVTKTYRVHDGHVRALNSVNLTLEQRADMALIGASGSGKSTLLSLIAGLDRPSSGTILVGGLDVTKTPAAKLPAFRFRHIGFIFQQYHLIPTLNAVENVMLPCAPWRVDYDPRQRAKELLDMVGLGHRMKHFPAQLSGGEQQRVCIARALINRPTILLADEPTGNLDEVSTGEVMRLIRRVTTEFQMTLLMVTHDMNVANTFSQVLEMRGGTLLS